MYEDILNQFPEKIDTISIKLNSKFLNRFRLGQMGWATVVHSSETYESHFIKEGLWLKRTKSIKKTPFGFNGDYGAPTTNVFYYYYCNIQYEYIWKKLLFNPKCQNNIICVIFEVLLDLKRFGILDWLGVCKAENYYKRWHNIDENIIGMLCNYREICSLSEIHFAFDFKEREIRKFSNCKFYGKTAYSTDHGENKSHWICYNRKEKEKAKNQLSNEAIKKIIYPERIEIRLTSKTCNYMNIDNLRGSFFEVFFRFAPIIAKSWKKYSICTAPKDQQHIFFNYIQDLAEFPSIKIPKKKQRV